MLPVLTLMLVFFFFSFCSPWPFRCTSILCLSVSAPAALHDVLLSPGSSHCPSKLQVVPASSCANAEPLCAAGNIHGHGAVLALSTSSRCGKLQANLGKMSLNINWKLERICPIASLWLWEPGSNLVSLCYFILFFLSSSLSLIYLFIGVCVLGYVQILILVTMVCYFKKYLIFLLFLRLKYNCITSLFPFFPLVPSLCPLALFQVYELFLNFWYIYSHIYVYIYS